MKEMKITLGKWRRHNEKEIKITSKRGTRKMVEWFGSPLLFIEGYSSFLNYP